MKLTRCWTLGWLAVLALTQPAWPQAFVPLHAEGQGGFVSLSSVPGQDPNSPLFLNTSPGVVSQATVGGRGSTNLGTLQIGFDYIRPFWSSRDFTLAVPSGNAGSFPLLGDIGNVDSQFALAPIVKYKYDVEDLGLAFTGSGTFLNLAGKLERTLTTSTGGQATLTANSSLTLVTANLPEVSTRFYYDELFTNHPHLYWSMFEDLVIDLGIGTRYSSIDQNYTGSLTNSVPGGANVSTRYSRQVFRGIGLTTFSDFSLPIKRDWIAFTKVRGSILVGDNTKDSTLTVNVVGLPGESYAISQSKTEFIPILELEVGLQCGYELGERLRDGAPPPLLTLRVAATGQFWGDVGPLSAGATQSYGNSDLYLVGAHVMVGFHR